MDDGQSYTNNGYATSYNIAGIPPGTANRLGTANVWNPQGFYGNNPDVGTARPMTSVNAVGFSSKPKSNLPEPFGRHAAPLQKKTENSPEAVVQEQERAVNAILEECALMCLKKDFANALDKAKEAVKKDKQLIKLKEQKTPQADQNFDLTYSIHFNLAKCYHANSMYTEALETYQTIVKNPNYQTSKRLRVNMGNIYFEQRDYRTAIKMYRMALDSVLAAHHRELRNKICRNIGIAFIKLGEYSDAIQSFDEIINSNNTDIDAAYNLVLCYYGTGDKRDMRKAFNKLLAVQVPGLKPEDDIDEENQAGKRDDLSEYLKDSQRKHYDYIYKAATLIAEVIDDDWESGFDYIIEQLKSFSLKRGDNKMSLVGEFEMTKALTYMKRKKFSAAIENLKEFEKKDKKLQAKAATNLAYLYLLEGDVKNALKHASLAVETDKYNASALVNKGCVHYINKEYQDAKALFIEAVNNESDCVQAIYNLGLVNKDLKEYKEALANFKKLHQIIPESIEVLHQISSTYSKMGDNTNAIEWYNMLTHKVPTDPGAQFDLGNIYTQDGDDSNSLHSYLESYRYYPINMDVVTWLGLYYVKHEQYERAITYFERATEINPNEVDWQLMVASCHRRMGAYKQAKKCYESIHNKYPENLEGLKYLVNICTELGSKKEKKAYNTKLKELEKKLQKSTSKKEEEEARAEEQRKANQDDILYKQQQAEQRRREEEQRNIPPSVQKNVAPANKTEQEDDLDADTNYIDDLY
ncbi:intraflagellar transport protein 88 [Acrasis kona]|uniref:Intraflagellar transport protein 88 n=1 Tax=Acrasis kona TaxID=1008807 RepID=A0AAW2ZHN0_9EUKA